MTITPDKFDTTKVNAGAVWSAMAAYSLEADPGYAELVALVGAHEAKHIAITVAGDYWNACRAGSSLADQARRGVIRSIEALIGPDADPGAVARIADSFYARLAAGM